MKKTKLLMVAATAAMAITASAFIINNKMEVVTKGEEPLLSATWDVNGRTSSNHFTTTTTSGNTLTCWGSNTIDGGSDYMVYFNSNGAGLYFDNAFQSIVSVTVTYKFASKGTLDLHLVPTESDFYSENDEKINMVPDISTGYNTVVTRTFTASNPSNTHYFRIWSTNAARIYDVTVNYYCAAL